MFRFGSNASLFLSHTSSCCYYSDVLSGETFDLLCSLGDFMEFKDVMVAQKNMKGASASVKASRGTGGSGLDLSISGHHL